MRRNKFFAPTSAEVPAVTEAQMREVDRIAVDDFGLGVLQMMENAGRNLALTAVEMIRENPGEVVVLAGGGGNGGGGISCARHLHNHGVPVRVVLSKSKEALSGPPAAQWRVLESAGLRATPAERAEGVVEAAALVVDALLGYSLQGAPRGEIGRLVDVCIRKAKRVLSLDVPSGIDATTGEAPGLVIIPEKTMTLALPKTGLTPRSGSILLADIGIPPEVYSPLGIAFKPFFDGKYRLPLTMREKDI